MTRFRLGWEAREFTSPRHAGGWPLPIITLWLLMLLPAVVWMFLTEDEGIRERLVVFEVAISIVACMSFSKGIFEVYALLFAPLLIITILIVVEEGGIKHKSFGFWVAISPLVSIFAYLTVGASVVVAYLVIWLPAVAVVPYLPMVFHLFTLRRFLIHQPRCKLQKGGWDPRFCHQPCRFCLSILSTSKLLRGSRLYIVRTLEVHRSYTSLEEMKRSCSSCSLCEAFLTPRSSTVDGSDQVDHPAATTNYGTMDIESRSDEEERLYVTIRLHKQSSLMIENGLVFVFQLFRQKMPMSDEILVREAYWGRSLDVSDNTKSSEVITKIHGWVNGCSEHQTECMLADQCYTPTRLIKVGTLSSPILRLVEAKEFECHQNNASELRYLALSHCWGGDIACKLTLGNIDAMKYGFEFESLTRNFQDAVEIARMARIQYIWIDSLCILQDCSDDWERESLTMGQVYKNAEWVISATASATSTGGCFRLRQPRTEGQTLLVLDTNRLYIADANSSGPTPSLPSVNTLFETRVESSPLAKRAWAFQERLLSRRMVHFCSDVVLYECNTVQASDLHHDEEKYREESYAVINGRIFDRLNEQLWRTFTVLVGTYGDDAAKHLALCGIRGALALLRKLGQSEHLELRERVEFVKRWYEIVGAYSEGELTIFSDRLVAISGIAQVVQTERIGPYAAGLWEEMVPELALLWRVKGQLRRAKIESSTPTWSWAAVNSPVSLLPARRIDASSFADNALSIVAKVRSFELQNKGSRVKNIKGSVDGGRLQIHGLRFRLYYRKPMWGLYTRSNRLSFNRKRNWFLPETAVDFFPDSNEFESTQEPFELGGSEGSELWGLLVMTLQVSRVQKLCYGIVLERMEGSIYTRIGVFSVSEFAFARQRREAQAEATITIV